MIEMNGKKYARVTEILKPFADFSHIDPLVLDNKARIGTQVHQAISCELKGDFPWVNNDSIGYFESYLKWRTRIQPEFIVSEGRYFDDKKMITGQIDALVQFAENPNVPILVDFKTSAQESKETWPMQAHLYAYLLEVIGIKSSSTYHFVKLSKNGALPHIFEYKFDRNIHNKCMKAIDDFWEKQIK